MLALETRPLSVAYLKTHARPLEKALYAYHFEGGFAEAVLQALAPYQNEDGGFGNGLESDLRVKDSSVLATTIAFQKFREVGAPAHHPMVKRACAYVSNTYDATNQIWQIIPPNADDAPHAPWWEYHGKPEAFLGNPRPEIVGYLYDYAEHFSGELRQTLTAAALDHLGTYGDEIEMHELLCYIRLLETPSLPRDIYQRMLPKLTELVRLSIPTDPSAWGSYGLTPLTVISSPNSPFYPAYETLIGENLAMLAGQVSAEGYWSPNWSWEFVSAEAWAQAERELRGVMTLNHLLLFRAFA